MLSLECKTALSPTRRAHFCNECVFSHSRDSLIPSVASCHFLLFRPGPYPCQNVPPVEAPCSLVRLAYVPCPLLGNPAPSGPKTALSSTRRAHMCFSSRRRARLGAIGPKTALPSTRRAHLCFSSRRRALFGAVGPNRLPRLVGRTLGLGLACEHTGLSGTQVCRTRQFVVHTQACRTQQPVAHTRVCFACSSTDLDPSKKYVWPRGCRC